jgi:hypothetical protein
MKKKIKALWSGLFNTLERSKGYRHYWVKPAGVTTNYDVVLGDGVEVRIFCEEVHHHYRYRNHPKLTDLLVTYTVYCEVAHNAPAKLKELFATRLSIPQARCRFCTRKYRHKSAVMAYLDHVYVHKKTIR